MEEALKRLKDFTSTNGWYELNRRLLDAGDTDYRDYAKIEPDMVAVPGQTNLFEFQGRQLQLRGKRKDPLLLKDASTGQVWTSASCEQGFTSMLIIFVPAFAFLTPLAPTGIVG